MCGRNVTAVWRVRGGGFTLMELLVVISIIALLMSILLPSLTRAQEQARRVHCAANLKNLTTAWMVYADDNEGKLCSGDTQSSAMSNCWVVDGAMIPGNDVGGTEKAITEGALWVYMRELESYRCKSDRSELLRSYCVSRAMNGATCTCQEDQVNPFRMLSEITRDSEKMVFVDAASRLNWIDGSFSPVKETETGEHVWYVRDGRNITARHTDGFNLSYADLHCDWWQYKDSRSVELAEWRISSEEASADNEDLLMIAEAVRSRRWGQ